MRTENVSTILLASLIADSYADENPCSEVIPMATYAADSNHHGAALVAVIRGQVGALATSSAYSYCLPKDGFWSATRRTWPLTPECREIVFRSANWAGLDIPSVFVFPQLVVCLDCGFAECSVPKNELRRLASGGGTQSRAETAPSGNRRSLSDPGDSDPRSR